MSDTQKDIFESTRQEIDDMLERFKEGVVKNSQTVKDGINTPEEELQEPRNLLFLKTYETVKHVMSQPLIINSFGTIVETLGEKATKDLALSLIAATSHAAYQSMVQYDGILRDELVKQFDLMVKQINMVNADVIGLKTTVQAQQKKISILENKSKAEDVKKSFE